jgi:hypothetical protein
MIRLLEQLSIKEQRALARLLNDWEKREQRHHPRIRCSIITEYRALDYIHKDTIKNISLGGAYIDSSRRFPPNLEIDQSFFFPNFEIPIHFRSQIVWTGPSGFGVQFEPTEGRK